MTREYLVCNSRELPEGWKTISRGWGHSLHSICARTGSFPPRLVHYFIEKFSSPGERILDLYSGKGTTVLESCLMGRKGTGNDVSPDAYVITAAKAQPPDKISFLDYLTHIKKRMPRASSHELDNENVRIYYSENTLKQILSLREIIEEDEFTADEGQDEPLRVKLTFLKALMLGILHGRASFALSLPMPHSFSMSPHYVEKRVAAEPVRFRRPERDVIECLAKKSELVYEDGIPDTFCFGEAYQSDAKELELPKPVDLIITSPPYLDAHTYAWDNWLRLWFLKCDYRRVNRTLLQTGSEKKYLEHMRRSLKNMNNMLRDDSRCFVIVGDVKGHEPLANLLADMINQSNDIGFTVYRVIVDDVRPDGRYIYGRNNHKGISIDRILELHKGNPTNGDKKVNWTY